MPGGDQVQVRYDTQVASAVVRYDPLAVELGQCSDLTHGCCTLHHQDFRLHNIVNVLLTHPEEVV